MRYAIISDIHSNLEALSTALIKIKQIGCDQIICIGDIVGYGPDPEACLDLVFENANKIILGNHDVALFKHDQIEQFSDYAKEAILWTLEKVPEKYVIKMKSLSLIYETEEILFVHSSPEMPEEWKYIDSHEEASLLLKKMENLVCFVGHSHKPIIFTNHTPGILLKTSPAIINVGSVGQPRDYNPLLSFGLFDSENWKYRNYRYEYDIKKTQKKIISNNLPLFLSHRLEIGI